MKMEPEWSSLVLRLIAEARKTLVSNSDGIAIIGVHVAVDARGTPLIWVVQDGKRVEPSKSAKETLVNLLSSG